MGEPLAGIPSNDNLEAPTVALCVFALVVPEALLLQAAEQVIRRNGNRGSLQGPLQEAPEVFEAVIAESASDFERRLPFA